jgi:hypothetical protein
VETKEDDTMDMAEFVGKTVLEMAAKGIKIQLSPGKSILHSDGTNCSGWFDPAEKEFACATGSESWLEIYAHEYCHFTQWLDGVLKEEGDVENEDAIWEWLGGADFPFETVEMSVRASQDLEADNERRTVALIRKYDLPIDVTTYIQKSNAYLLFYDVVLRTRRWSNGDTPSYSVPEIYQKLPGDRILDNSELRSSPVWFQDMVKERCISLAKPKTLWALLVQKCKTKVFRRSVYDPT